MARPSIAGWRRNRPKGHARDRPRRKPATRDQRAFRVPADPRLPWCEPCGRSVRPNVFPTHSSLGTQRQTRRQRNGTNDVRPKGNVQGRTLSVWTAKGWPEGHRSRSYLFTHHGEGLKRSRTRRPDDRPYTRSEKEKGQNPAESVRSPTPLVRPRQLVTPRQSDRRGHLFGDAPTPVFASAEQRFRPYSIWPDSSPCGRRCALKSNSPEEGSMF